MSTLTENAFILLNKVGGIEAVNIVHSLKQVTIAYTTTKGNTGHIMLQRGDVKPYGLMAALRLLKAAGFAEVVVCLQSM